LKKQNHAVVETDVMVEVPSLVRSDAVHPLLQVDNRRNKDIS
jgi:hypothetical protein